MSESEEQDDSQKTEEPTPKKLEEARRKGQVPLSREINNWVMLLAATVVVVGAGPLVLRAFLVHLRAYIEKAHLLPGVPGGLGIVLGESFWGIVSILILPLLILLAAAFIGPFVQVGPIFAPETLKPDLSKISPIKGFKRLFSMRSLMEFAKGILKIGIIALVGLLLLYPFYGQVENFIGLPIVEILSKTHGLILRLMAGVLVVLLVVAVIDLLYQRFEHAKKMRMTRQEIKDEFKQTEGDPHVRARLRQLRQERARTRMLQAVPEADVVITNPTHYAVALKYEPAEMEAPMMVAKGLNEVAFRIRDAAKENDVVIVENPPLARVLFDTMDIDQAVPHEHYKAVAEVISYVFQLKGKLKPETGHNK